MEEWFGGRVGVREEGGGGTQRKAVDKGGEQTVTVRRRSEAEGGGETYKGNDFLFSRVDRRLT